VLELILYKQTCRNKCAGSTDTAPYNDRKKRELIAIANRSRVSCAHNQSIKTQYVEGIYRPNYSDLEI